MHVHTHVCPRTLSLLLYPESDTDTYTDTDPITSTFGASLSHGASRGIVPEVVGHLEAMLESGELSDVVIVAADGLVSVSSPTTPRPHPPFSSPSATPTHPPFPLTPTRLRSIG